MSSGNLENPPKDKNAVSRRKFFKTAGKVTSGVAAGLFCLHELSSVAAAKRPQTETCDLPQARFELRFNTKLCAGCALCATICAQFHEGDAGPTHRNRFTFHPLIEDIGISTLSANAPGRPQPLVSAQFADMSTNEFCRQCISPECMDVCPEEANAIYVDEKTGARVVDASKCIGCGNCEEACQFGMIKVNSETEIAYKCDFCSGDPQCVSWCPTKAITFHKR
jgi:Fe-S-cluster-containing dehydrogenase component